MRVIKITGIIFVIGFLLSGCKKDGICVSEISEQIALDIHYNEIGCTVNNNGNENFTWFFNTLQEFEDFQCSPNLPIELGFDGIVLAQGVKALYGGQQAYERSVQLFSDSCTKHIDFRFILKTIDTSNLFENNENVIVLLNGIDSTYTVNFSHEIIPFGQ